MPLKSKYFIHFPKLTGVYFSWVPGPLSFLDFSQIYQNQLMRSKIVKISQNNKLNRIMY